MTKQPIEVPTHPKRKSGAQRRKEWMKRPYKLINGVWCLDLWQPHPRVLRGKPRKDTV